MVGKDPLEQEGLFRADLRLLMRREYVDNSVDGRYRAVRMQRRENEVSRFTDRQRGLDGLEVAHFADENDVRILTQDILESGLESLGVRTHLSLVDDRHL